MQLDASIECWQERLRKPLPGRVAQSWMAPGLSYGRHSDRPAWNARPAAVMALLYRRGNHWHLPLTVRPPHLSDHAGQICLPGGAIQAGETPNEAALRELHEEVGAGPEGVRIVGHLSRINLFVSNFSVTPCVAVANDAPRFTLDPGEVEELIELPLDVLLDPNARGRDRIPGRAIPISAPYFNYRGHRIWGATAMVLSELAAIWQEIH